MCRPRACSVYLSVVVLAHFWLRTPSQVLVTVGVGDNLSDGEICEALCAPLASGEPAAALAQTLASLAHAASQQQTRNTPFAQGAKQHGFAYPGGKPDDITVLCVRVLKGGVEDDETQDEGVRGNWGMDRTNESDGGRLFSRL